MTLEQVFECPHTLSKLRSGPLGGLMNGFCDDLLASGFSRSTVRKHLSNVSHLNVYLMTRKGVAGHSLSSQDVSEFLRDYPLRARNRGPLDRHIAGVKTAINRLVKYLCVSGHHFETLVEAAIYQPLLEAYLNWLEEHQHAAPGTIRLRAHNLDQFLQWLGHADINTTHIYLEIVKRRMIEKLDAPVINDQAPWHKPGIIEWLNILGSKSGLCEVNPGRMKRYDHLWAVNFT